MSEGVTTAALSASGAKNEAVSAHVVIVDDDRDVAELIREVLVDEGFTVTCLYEPHVDALRAAIERIEPACVILDGFKGSAYGTSWETATWLATRPRLIPTIMLTGHEAEIEEAMLGESARTGRARFAGVISKPFDIDMLADSVRLATGETPEPTQANDQAYANDLYERLRAAGARDLQASRSHREWVTFRIGDSGTLMKVYRWRLADMYFVGRYSSDGEQLEPLAQFADLDALIEFCVRIIGSDASE